MNPGQLKAANWVDHVDELNPFLFTTYEILHELTASASHNFIIFCQTTSTMLRWPMYLCIGACQLSIHDVTILTRSLHILTSPLWNFSSTMLRETGYRNIGGRQFLAYDPATGTTSYHCKDPTSSLRCYDIGYIVTSAASSFSSMIIRWPNLRNIVTILLISYDATAEETLVTSRPDIFRPSILWHTIIVTS